MLGAPPPMLLGAVIRPDIGIGQIPATPPHFPAVRRLFAVAHRLRLEADPRLVPTLLSRLQPSREGPKASGRRRTDATHGRGQASHAGIRAIANPSPPADRVFRWLLPAATDQAHSGRPPTLRIIAGRRDMI